MYVSSKGRERRIKALPTCTDALTMIGLADHDLNHAVQEYTQPMDHAVHSSQHAHMEGFCMCRPVETKEHDISKWDNTSKVCEHIIKEKPTCSDALSMSSHAGQALDHAIQDYTPRDALFEPCCLLFGEYLAYTQFLLIEYVRSSGGQAMWVDCGFERSS